MPVGRKKGHFVSEETKEKISNALKIAYKEGKRAPVIEQNHSNWKGEEVGYQCLHKWVRRQKGNAKKCEHCGSTTEEKRYEWANKDHKYRRNLDDFMELCVDCHGKYDRKNNLKRK